jgi:hypothetical protein
MPRWRMHTSPATLSPLLALRYLTWSSFYLDLGHYPSWTWQLHLSANCNSPQPVKELGTHALAQRSYIAHIYERPTLSLQVAALDMKLGSSPSCSDVSLTPPCLNASWEFQIYLVYTFLGQLRGPDHHCGKTTPSMAVTSSQFFGFAAGVPEGGPAGTASPGCAAPKPDTLSGGARAAALGAGGSRTRSSRPAPAGKALGPAALSTGREFQMPVRSWSGSAAPEPGRRCVPGERFGPVTDAGGAGQDASPKAGLPVPGRGVR